MSLLQILIACILMMPFASKGDGAKYLRLIADKFSEIADYTVDVRVHLEMESVKAPDMSATIYFKSPDKVKIDSKGTFLLPKEVGVFNPRMFNPDEYIVDVVDTLPYNGNPAVRLSLSPRKEALTKRTIILVIDRSEWLIRELMIEPAPGSVMDAKIWYESFDGFMLPTEVNVNLNLPKADSTQEGMNQGRRFRGGMSGNVVIYYSNYKVNSGLSDSLFKKENRNSP